MERRPPVCKVSQHDTKVNRPAEDADAQTANASGGSFGEIGRSHDGRLPNSEAHDKSAGKDLAVPSIGCDEDDYTDNPDRAELASSPQTAWPHASASSSSFMILVKRCKHTNLITCDESNQSPTNTANLNHCSDIPNFVCKLSSVLSFCNL
jgi:hypothetical protein